MRRHTIGGADWRRVKGLLPRRGPKADNRRFVSAVLYVARTGNPWRDLPARFGKWNTAFRRFRRWAGAGVWGRVLEVVRDPDVSTLVLDATVVRAHPAAAGGAKKRAAGPRPEPRRVGTKVHGCVTGKGHPVALKLTPGPAGDAPHAADLLAGRRRGEVKAVVADRGYDRDANVRLVRRLRARVVIPPLGCRTRERRYGKALYKGRDVVERFRSEAKPYRRVATRYDKLDTSYLAFVHLASVLIVLRNP